MATKGNVEPPSDSDKIIMILLVLFLPPLAIWFYDKACTGQVCLNIILFILGVLPAVIHAVWYCFIRNG